LAAGFGIERSIVLALRDSSVCANSRLWESLVSLISLPTFNLTGDGQKKAVAAEKGQPPLPGNFRVY
jgi:hypothetical protein